MRKPTITVYESLDGHRWRLQAANRRILADSAEAYKTRFGARMAAKRLLRDAQRAEIIVEAP